jgi:hypothetical protein
MAKGIKTGGRRKGTPNKMTQNVKAAILEAFENAGGREYLEAVADKDPKTFCALLARCIPTEITGDINHRYVITAPLEAATPEEWAKLHAPTIQ